MTDFKPGDRVTTELGNMVGTVLEGGDPVVLEWDDPRGPQEDEVDAALLRHANTS